jgi:small subunit ribosomal protein S16
MVTIRLARHGKKSKPFYHIVATDSRSARNGRFLEKLGHFDPNHKPSQYVIKADRVQHWFGLGAQLSTQVAKLVKVENIELKRVVTKK